jgi:hypothetical protein
MRQRQIFNVEINGCKRSLVVAVFWVLLCTLFAGAFSARAQANGQPIIIEIDDQIPLLNPCTGELTEASFTGTERFTYSQNEQANLHRFIIEATLDVETADGFVGRESFALSHIGEGLPRPADVEGWGVLTEVDRVIAQNRTTHQVLLMKFQLHRTYRNGEFMVDFENFSAECRG